MVASNLSTVEQDELAAQRRVDRTLLEQVAAGDRAAFDQLYVLYQARVYGVVAAVLRDRAQAQEFTQEVFLQLWQQASRFDGSRGATATWIQHLAHARAVDRVRLCESAGARDTRYTRTSQPLDYDTVVEQILLGDERASLRESLHSGRRDRIGAGRTGTNTRGSPVGVMKVSLASAAVSVGRREPPPVHAGSCSNRHL